MVVLRDENWGDGSDATVLAVSHKVLSADLQDLCKKKLSVVAHNCDAPSTGEAGTDRSLGPTSRPAMLKQRVPGSEGDPASKY